MRRSSYSPYFTHGNLHFCISMTCLQYPIPCPPHVTITGYTAQTRQNHLFSLCFEPFQLQSTLLNSRFPPSFLSPSCPQRRNLRHFLDLVSGPIRVLFVCSTTTSN